MATLLITGASSGIGRELVARAIKRGDKVIGTARSEKDLAGFGTPHNFKGVVMDVASSESVIEGFKQADAFLAGTPLDVVINSAAYAPLGAVEVQPVEQFEKTLNTNANGSYRVTQQALPRLRGHDGRLVLVTSLWGRVAGPMLSAYCASKWAIEALADTTRRETHGHGLHVILIEPGVVKTRMVDRQYDEAVQAAKDLPESYASSYGALYNGYPNLIAKGKPKGISVDDCCAQIEAAAFARKPKTRYRVGLDSKAVCTMGAVLSDRALDGVFKSMVK